MVEPPSAAVTVVVDAAGRDPALVGRLIRAGVDGAGPFPSGSFDPPVRLRVRDRGDADRMAGLLAAAGATVHIEHGAVVGGSRAPAPAVDWVPTMWPNPAPARLCLEAPGPDPALTARLLAVELGPTVTAVPAAVMSGALPIELPDGTRAERLRAVLRAAGATVRMDRNF